MEHECLFPYSQESATSHYPERYESRTHTQSYFFEIDFNIVTVAR
jgi:hypothetical protein